VVVPAYNEINSIQNTIEDLISILDNSLYEIIVVDDNSTDGTFDKISNINGIKVITHSKNSGYGASIKSGIIESKYELIAITDADGTYPNDKIPSLLTSLNNDDADMVVGSRTGTNVNIPLIRRPAKWFIGKLANYVTNQKIPDINSGLRVFKKKSFLNFISIIPDGFSLTTTITLGMLSGGYNVKFKDIDYFKRAGKSKIKPIRDTINFIKLILKMGLFFAPFKIFLPLSFFILLLSFIWGIISKFYFGLLADVSVLILSMAAFQTMLFALIAELINRRLPNRYNK
jgi:glycosyltransferase involved in cell wall biosynthesis